jgi:hypothetical protein
VYVSPFPGPGPRTRVSPAGVFGGSPRWRHDGKELFYVAIDNQLMAAEVRTGGTSFAVTNVRPLFNIHAKVSGGNKFDASAEGQRFLINMSVESTAPSPITLVVNWTAGLKQ